MKFCQFFQIAGLGVEVRYALKALVCSSSASAPEDVQKGLRGEGQGEIFNLHKPGIGRSVCE